MANGGIIGPTNPVGKIAQPKVSVFTVTGTLTTTACTSKWMLQSLLAAVLVVLIERVVAVQVVIELSVVNLFVDQQLIQLQSAVVGLVALEMVHLEVIQVYK